MRGRHGIKGYKLSGYSSGVVVNLEDIKAVGP